MTPPAWVLKRSDTDLQFTLELLRDMLAYRPTESVSQAIADAEAELRRRLPKAIPCS